MGRMNDGKRIEFQEFSCSGRPWGFEATGSATKRSEFGSYQENDDDAYHDDGGDDDACGNRKQTQQGALMRARRDCGLVESTLIANQVRSAVTAIRSLQGHSPPFLEQGTF